VPAAVPEAAAPNESIAADPSADPAPASQPDGEKFMSAGERLAAIAGK
jgi:hypothetical protein